MKKLLALSLTVLMAVGLVACSNTTDETPAGDDTTAETVKFGLGVSNSVSVSSATADEEGEFQVNSTYAYVVLDSEGVIKDVKIDVAQETANWTAAGEVTADVIPTKLNRGNDYGMKETSAQIGNIEGGGEWFEQAAAYEEYLVGKTAADVEGMELGGDHGSPVDLATSCTISVAEFNNAVLNAIENATEVSGAATFGFASVTSPTAESATADATGTAQYDTSIAAVALDADGKIVTVHVDVAQQGIKDITTTGATEATAETVDLRTKAEKKEDYGMKDTSAQMGNIEGGGEWYEQAAAYEAYLVGKTAADVEGMELDTENHSGPVDLATSCTMSVVDLNAAVVAACEAAE